MFVNYNVTNVNLIVTFVIMNKQNSSTVTKLNALTAGSNSVSTPGAQTPELWHRGDARAAGVWAGYRRLLTSLEVSLPEKMLTELIALNGLRVSEALSVESKCITQDGRILIKGGKGSSDRICFSREYVEEWKRKRLNSAWNVRYISRYRMYRLFKKYDITWKEINHKKTSVTHAFRKLAARDVYLNEKNLVNITTALGHKSKKSAKHYVPGK